MEYFIFAGAILLIILLIMVNGYLDSRRNKKRFIKRLHEQYGGAIEREYQPGELEQHIAMYYRKHPVDGQIDDITWNDLHMDEIYRKMNYSHSLAGDEYLYYRLRTPIRDKEELDRFENRVNYFMSHENERIDFQVCFFELGRMNKYSLYEYLEYLESLGERRNASYYLAILLVFVSVGVMFFSVPAGVLMLLTVLCRNMMNYYREQKEIDPYITSFRYIARLLDAAEKIGGQPVEVVAGEQKRLLGCRKAMSSFSHNSYIVFSSSVGSGGVASGNLLDTVFDYLRMVFYLDLIKFNQMLDVVRNHLAEIDEMVTLMGQIETMIVVGEYRKSLQEGYCVPELIPGDAAGKELLTIERLYHPLIQNPVKNDICVERGVLLTGSNASGKSTFLRAAALSAVLAQTIHTCMAGRYRGGMFRVYSSMSLQDDLESGDSYYMVEVKSIRRILAEVERAKAERIRILCFVDEVLRGTNTVERIAASTQILKALAGAYTICFAATHDVELTKLLDRVYDNYHFEEEISEDDIFFPYRLQKGPATSRNAIALLKMLGYDKELVEEAEAMAETFLQTGKWQRQT